MDNLSQAVSFRVTPQTKMALHEKSTALGMTISEYLNSIISEHDRIKEELVRKAKSLHESATEVLVQFTDKKELEIRDQERTKLAVSPQAYQLPRLQKLYAETKGQDIRVEDAFGAKRTVRITSLYSLVEAILENYSVIDEVKPMEDIKSMLNNR